jgi:uncharacterized protein
MEAKKQGAGEEDLSMEEILQSIRRIIADEEDPSKDQAAAAAPDASPTPAPTAPATPEPSDVLELTDMIAEEPITSTDVLGQIDAMFAPEPAPVAAAAEPAPTAAHPTVDNTDALLSGIAEQAALSSLSKLSMPDAPLSGYTPSPSPGFRSGNTVEDMVAEMLRPMMKTWLDTNLPGIVERIVEREVVRLTRR